LGPKGWGERRIGEEGSWTRRFERGIKVKVKLGVIVKKEFA